MAQTVLAQRIGVTFQQVQKYERGANRVAASTLFSIAKVLDLPVTAFFPAAGSGTSGALTETEDALELRLIYSRLSPRARELFLATARAFGAQEGEGPKRPKKRR